jgi:hypothetical protein
LDLILAHCRTSFGLEITDTDIIRDYLINDNLIFILLIQGGSNKPGTLFIGAYILYTGGVFIQGFKEEFVLNRGVINNFKKIVKR